MLENLSSAMDSLELSIAGEWQEKRGFWGNSLGHRITNIKMFFACGI
jgi:hypothetical protein